MLSIKQAKIDVVVKQFEQQLLKEAQLEERRLQEQLNQDFEKQLQALSSKKDQSQSEIQTLQKQLQDQINFFNVVKQELASKNTELEGTYQASIQHLRREVQKTQDA